MKNIENKKDSDEAVPFDIDRDRENNGHRERGWDEFDTHSNRASQVLESESICYGAEDVIRALLG